MVKIQLDLNEKQDKIVRTYCAIHNTKKTEAIQHMIDEYAEKLEEEFEEEIIDG